MIRSETFAGAEPGVLPARLLFVVLLLLILPPNPVRAEPAAGTAAAAAEISVAGTVPWGATPVLLADDDGWSINRLFRSLNNRTTILQFCVAMMALALAILMKK